MSCVLRKITQHLREWAKIAWGTAWTFAEIDGEQRAAAFAYYALFSLFPFFALLLTAGSSFFDSQTVIHTLERFFPIGGDEQKLIWKTVATLERSRGSVGIVSFLILVWSSLKFFQALVRGVNRAWHMVEIPWWQLPLKNLLMIAVVTSALLIGLVAPAILQAAKKILLFFGDFVKSHVPGLNIDMIGWIFEWSRYAISGGVLFYSFTLLYMLAPRGRVRFRQVWFPALLVTLALQAFQNAFVNYLPRFVNYNAIYGTVGVLMLLLLWVYIAGISIILGACLCAEAAKVLEVDQEAEPTKLTPPEPAENPSATEQE